jgi:hypothetical protein
VLELQIQVHASPTPSWHLSPETGAVCDPAQREGATDALSSPSSAPSGHRYGLGHRLRSVASLPWWLAALLANPDPPRTPNACDAVIHVVQGRAGEGSGPQEPLPPFVASRRTWQCPLDRRRTLRPIGGGSPCGEPAGGDGDGAGR